MRPKCNEQGKGPTMPASPALPTAHPCDTDSKGALYAMTMVNTDHTQEPKILSKS